MNVSLSETTEVREVRIQQTLGINIDDVNATDVKVIEIAPVDQFEIDASAVTPQIEVVLAPVSVILDSTESQGAILQAPSGGTFNNGAIKSWVIGETTTSTAVGGLNDILAKLLPPQPTPLSLRTLLLASAANTHSGSNILLCSGVPVNTSEASPPAAGAQIFRTTGAVANSQTVASFGSGNSGTLSAWVNGASAGSLALNTSSQVGVNSSLQITRDAAFPSDKPGFWEELDAVVSSAVSVGVNSFQLRHTETGNTNVAFFCRDALTAVPTTTAIAVTPPVSPVTTFSSSIPHYTAGNTFEVAATVTDLAGETYLSAGAVQIDSIPSVGTLVNVGPGQGGLPAVMSRNVGTQTILPTNFTVSGNVAVTTRLRARGRNPQGDGAWLDFASQINVLAGSPTSGILELSVPVVNMGTGANAARIVMSGGDTPADDKSALLTSDWVANAALQAHDAAVRGGVLLHDQTNYANGLWLPAGPNLSVGRSGAQYATFMMRRAAISQFRIAIAGTYAGCWVKLPQYLNWWSMFTLYSGAGIPTVGCALGTVMSGNSGTFTCTFGQATSSLSPNNLILVRLRLNAGQSVSSLQFTGV